MCARVSEFELSENSAAADLGESCAWVGYPPDCLLIVATGSGVGARDDFSVRVGESFSSWAG
jgi:hypothetical protein